MKKLKVAFCVRDMKIGGVESVLIRTMDMLLKHKDIELSVITYVNIKEPVYLDWFRTHPEVKVHALYPVSWLGTDLCHFFLARIFQHLCRDVYRWFKRTLFGLKKFKEIDVFIDYFNFSFDKEFKKLTKPKINWWHASIDSFISGNYIKYMNDYNKLVALTDGFVSDFKKLYPQYEKNIVRIYNPIDIDYIEQKSKMAQHPKGKYFCSVSRLYADKDIPTLLNGFDAFWNMNNKPDVKLYVIGDGSYRIRYEELAKSLSASNQIIFTGALPNPFGYMKGAIANILSSKSEGFALVLAEAIAVGAFNISSDCRNGPSEILCDGAGGLLFEPGNAEQLAKCMDAVFNNRIDIKNMKSVAYNGLKRFDADRISKDIIKLIKSYA